MSFKKELKEVCYLMKNDDGYRHGWVSNIAMCIRHEFEGRFNHVHIGSKELSDLSTNASERFLNLLCGQCVNEEETTKE